MKTPIFLLTISTIINITNLQASLYNKNALIHPIISQKHMISSQEKHATKAGLKTLKKGGNAIDAALSVAYSLSVTLPEAGNLCGGGFMLIYIKDENQTYALDFREKAPLLATETLFQNKDGTVNKEKSRNSIHAVGVPGTIKGLDLAWKKFGSLPLKTCLKPAINLAKNGFPVSMRLHEHLDQAKNEFLKKNTPPLAFYPNQQTIKVDEILKQPHLAKSLQHIAKKGESAFYNGPLGKKLITFMKNNNGLITQKDLQKYQAKFRKPITGTYKNHQIISMPPPSSGGIHLIQMLNAFEQTPSINQKGFHHPDHIETLINAMRIAYQDRAAYLGDSDFVDIPKNLTNKNYIKKRLKNPIPSKNTPIPKQESTETTHFTIVDQQGNIVSCTLTLNFRFGNKMIVPETGMILNNEMDDFSAKPGSQNAYGLVGSIANKIEPEKRMLSSMTPTIVFKNNQPFLATGTPGGSRIISMIFQQIINIIDYDMNLAEAIAAPRIHYQWKPDILFLEKGISPLTQSILKQKSYNIKKSRAAGSIQAIMIKDKTLFGFSDPRSPDGLTASTKSPSL